MALKKLDIQAGTNIQYLSKELLFLGLSGQPYRGSVYINFTSQGETFDLLDFKRFITSMRSLKIESENISFYIYKHILNDININDLGIIVDLSARGGIQQRLLFGENFIPHSKPNIFQI